MSAKTTSWNEFSSTMASVIIYLANTQKFNFSKYILTSLVKNLEAGVPFYMFPMFIQVFVITNLVIYHTLKVLDLENEVIKMKSSHKAKIEELESWVEKLEEENRGGKLLILMLMSEVNPENVYNLDMAHEETVLSMQDVDVQSERIEDVVKYAEDVVATAENVEGINAATIPQISKDDVTLAQTLTEIKTAKPKAKRVTMQEPSEFKTKYLHNHHYLHRLKTKVQSRQSDAVRKYQALKRKPMSVAQARKNMMIYLKNMTGYKMDYFKGMSYVHIRPIFEMRYNKVQAYLNKVPEMDAEKIKAPRKRTRKEKMEKDQPAKKQKDIEVLWKIVKDRFKKSQQKEVLDVFLWHTLKVMFEHTVEDNVWKHHIEPQGLARVKNWKLFDSCGVYCVTLETIQLFLFDKKMYPLTNYTLQQMFNEVRLQVDYEVEMAYDLLRLIISSLGEDCWAIKDSRVHKDKIKITTAVGHHHKENSKWFGGNDATKKTQRNLLKQQFENLSGSSSKSLDQTVDKLQKLVSQLELLGEVISQEDINKKFLRSLPSEGGMHVGVNTANRVYTASSQVNAASLLNIDNLIDAVIYASMSSQPNSTYLVNEDLEQIYPDNLEEMDLKWKCEAPRGQDIRSRDVTRRTVIVETPNSSALVSCDGLGGYDWSDQAEEGPTNYALMAYSTSSASSSDSKVSDVEEEKLEKKEVKPSINWINFVKATTDNNPRETVKNGEELKKTLIVKEVKKVNTAKPKAAVNAAKAKAKYNVVKGNKGNAVKASACWGNPHERLQDKRVIDSGCSRHMTGNMSFLTDYEEIDGGYIAFGGNPKGGKITGKGGLTCLFAKAIEDESKHWHRRLRHLNFKTINKLVKGNLVRDLPSKIFENDQSEINQFCKVKGIMRQHSVARTPKQNRIAKKRNRTFIEAARTMLADLKMPTTFWAEAVNTACYVQNKNSQDNEFQPSNDGAKKVDEDLRQENKWNDQKEEDSTNSTNRVNNVISNINIASSSRVNVVGINISIDLLPDPNMPSLEDIGIFEDSHDDEDVVGAEANFHNLDSTFQVSLIPTIRIHKVHPLEQVIKDLHSVPSTMRMTNNLEEHDLVGKKAIGSKWVFKKKMDKRGIVIRNKARLVAQRNTQEDGIDYDEVFAPVVRIEAIRLFLTYALFKEFIVYQMVVKSAFLYGKIGEEVYVFQPPRFEDPDFLDKVYKVEKEMCDAFEVLMHENFRMSSMDELTFFLGLQVKQKK
uniref:Ribonuclease H-like domain-containing protein n=1 Tax=Tanacetum cinerariifolium TaxID=118510 RepID=A0A699GY80_TANCI|nr:ribonuclease H-like domain-containing protein [Tanacetum cinerariifolium]